MPLDFVSTSTERRFVMDDGTVLAADAWGDSAAPAAILLHGGGQTRHAWKRTAATLAGHGFQTLSVDLRGHGDSGWSPDGDYRIDRFAADVRTLAASFPGKPVLIGASLGGIASLIAEGEAPESIATVLILVDITPRVDPSGVARIRGFMGSHIDDGFATLEEAADAIAAYLPHRPRPRSLDGLRKNLRLGDDGRWRWHYDPAFVRRIDTLEENRETRLSAAARRLTVPALLVRGAASELVSEDAARDFLALAPGARYVDVQGAGHMVAGDVNDPFTRAVIAFLDEQSSEAATSDEQGRPNAPRAARR
jgi:pimeloyl-ACP methyl ester carboxylesterase